MIIIFEKLVEVLVSGCDYWRIADEPCAATAPRRRPDEWIAAGVMEALRKIALNACTYRASKVEPLGRETVRLICNTDRCGRAHSYR